MKKKFLLGTTLLAMAALAGAGMHADAQTAAGGQPPKSAIGGASSSDEADIVITGTRIRVPDYQTSNPITSVTSATLQSSGATNVGDYLTSVPALVGSIQSTDSSGDNAFVGGTGLSLLNLRNLGVDRTLVLVDGRRHVGGLAGSAAVDINTIPQDLIERVEVLTGGASAIYGADGVSGVVNFVMKKNFEGVQAGIQYGRPQKKGGRDTFLTFTAGEPIGEKGNVALSFEYDTKDPVKVRDRDSTRLTIHKNPADTGENDGIFDNIFIDDVRFYDSNPGSAIDPDFSGIPTLLSDGSPFIGVISNPEIFVPDFYQQGGSGTPTFAYGEDLLGQTERYNTNLLFHYDFSPQVKLFSQLKYVRSHALSAAQPSFDFYLYDDASQNPLIPAGLAAALPPGQTDFIFSRDNFDLGVRKDDATRDTIRAVFGFEGDLNSHLNYNVSYVFGSVHIKNIQENNRYNDRFYAAIDIIEDPITHQPTCRSNVEPIADPLVPFNQPFIGFAGRDIPQIKSFTPGAGSGCVPLNLYGEGSPSQAAIDWVMFDSIDKQELDQEVVNGYLAGDLGDFIKPQGGPISFAVGGEYRREHAADTPDPADTSGVTFGNAISPTDGKFDVREAFGEVRIPIANGLPFADKLTLDGAYRYSDYSTSGITRTWKGGFEWAPIRDVTFRGTRAKAVRAPNINELFGANSQTFEFITDPCDEQELTHGTSFRAANCATILSGLGVADPAHYNDLNSSNISGTAGGNADLSPETARTTTLGLVFRPRFLPDLTASVDWYNIKIADAINQAEGQQLADLCVDQATVPNQFCNAITRQSGTGRITDFSSGPQNVASFFTRGIDYSIRYRLDPADLGVKGDWGKFNFGLVGNHLEKLEFVPIAGSPIENDLGEVNAPEWQATFNAGWDRGPWTVNYAFSWFSETSRFDNDTLANVAPDFAPHNILYYDALRQHDIQVRYNYDDRFDLYAGINNFTNQEPSTGSEAQPISPLGRFFYVGLRTKLPAISEMAGK